MKDTSVPKYSQYKPFQKFIEAVLEAFQFLIEDFAFELESIGDHAPECTVRFRNKTTGVEVTYDVPELPCVSVAQLNAKKSAWGKQYGLIYLIEERCPSQNLIGFQAETLTLAQFKPILRHYAQVLKECGSDILKGDFSIFPKLEKRAQKRIRRLLRTKPRKSRKLRSRDAR
jgi:hypothetical protein